MFHRSAALRVLLVVCAFAFAMPGSAQTVEDEYTPEPAHIAYIDGGATLLREGRAETAVANLPIVAGDRLSTQEGRAEILFGDGSVLDVDHFTSVELLSDDLLRLLDGRIRLSSGGRERVDYRIDTPGGAVRIEAPGEYRISLLGESGRRLDVEVIAYRGYATLVNEHGETRVRAGERAFAAAGMAPSFAQAFNSATWDAFDRWAADRRDERTGALSVEYLPDDVQRYAGAFDRYGDWRYESEYGYVWYPRVRVGWRPYYHGRWSYYRPWGWTWIAYDPWGWPTHHYGRWGLSAGVWFWIPSRRWAPAHVYWASAPDYIGWCPLGWNDRPIFNIVNVNIRVGRGYDPYHAWTVLPRRAFASHVDVSRYAVPRRTLEYAVPRWSVSGAAAPVRPAAARAATPIYSAGRASAVRRGEGSRPAAGLSGAPAYESRPSGPGANRADAAPREYSRIRPGGADAPRTVAPSAPGVLAPPASGARPRYRDLGPGGQDPGQGQGRNTYERRAPRYRAPGSGGPASDPGAIDRGGAPESRMPSRDRPEYSTPSPGAPTYGSPSRTRPQYRDPGAAPSPREPARPQSREPGYAPPTREHAAPRYREPARPQSGDPGGGGGRSYSREPRQAPAPRGEAPRAQPQRPSRGAPHAVPRGGSGPAPSRGSDRPSSRKPS